MYLMGRVSISDGSTVPHDVMIARVCGEITRQQVYVGPNGEFSMHLGSRSDSFLDASADRTQNPDTNTQYSEVGIPRRELITCELRASAPGLRSKPLDLVGLDTFGSTIDVGKIILERTTKVKGNTVDAKSLMVPKDARKAFEKGIQLEKTKKFADAQKYFEQAVQLYPKYASASFHLGFVLQKQGQDAAARAAFVQATTSDAKFLPPFLSLAEIAIDGQNWSEALRLTNHILEQDPLGRADITAAILDLDSLNSAEAYFYNAVANYKLNRLSEAEKSALKAEQYVALSTRSPQLHLLLADLFSRKNKYASAISELRTYLELDPNAENADNVQQQIAELTKLHAASSAKSSQN